MGKLVYDDVYKVAFSIAEQNNLNENSINISQGNYGRYCVEIDYSHEPGKGITFYIPEDVSSTSTFSTYVHGSGGGKVGQLSLDYEAANSGSVITLYPRGKTSHDYATDLVVSSISTMENQFNINTVEYATSGFSAGDGGCMNISTALLKKNPNAYHNVTYIDPKMDQIDEYGRGSNVSKMSDADAQLFKGDNVHITAYMTENNYTHNPNNNDQWLRNFYKPFADNNNFLLVADGTVGQHGYYRDRILSAGVMDGGFDWIERIGINNPNLNVKTRYLNESNNNLYNEFSNKISNAIALKSGNINQNTINKNNSENIVSAALGNGLYSTVESDYQLVESYTNNLGHTISSSGILINDIDNSVDSSGLKTISNARNMSNKYILYTKELYNKLFNANNNIIKAGQSIVEMDDGLMSLFSEEAIKRALSYDYESLNVNNSLLSGNVEKDNNIYKIKMSDLENAISDDNPINAMFLQDVIDNRRIKYSLEAMIDGFKKKLKGEAWELILEKLYAFDELLVKKNNYAMELNSNIKNSYKVLIDYMRKYDLSEIDTSKIGELEHKKALMDAERFVLSTTLNNLRATHGNPIYGLDDKGNSIVTGYVDNSASISAYESQLNNIEKLIKILERILEGFYGFPSIDNEAASIIGNKFNTSVFENHSLDNISLFKND